MEALILSRTLGLREPHERFGMYDALLLTNVLAAQASEAMLLNAVYDRSNETYRIRALSTASQDRGIALSKPLLFTPATMPIIHGPPALQDDSQGDLPLGKVYVCNAPIQALAEYLGGAGQAEFCLEWMTRLNAPFIVPAANHLIMQLKLSKERSIGSEDEIYPALITLKDLTKEIPKNSLARLFTLVDQSGISRKHAKNIYLTARLAEIQHAFISQR